MHVLEIRRRVLALEGLRLDPVQIDLHLVGDAAMDERLVQRFVSVLEAGVFADDGYGHLAIRIGHGLRDLPPLLEVRLRCIGDVEGGEHLAIETFVMIGTGHVVDAGDVERLDDRLGPHIAEQRDLAPLVARQRPVGAASRTSGWMPIERSSLTECWVGLVLSSPALGMKGTSVRWMKAGSRAAARCRAGGSPRRTAGPRCRRPCRRSRTARSRRPRCRR